ncbi:hypothetical protein K438DRAFT_81374 [Mycena galopus ATCC 62051]|nr:hypothetical protein K438DRAFT_595382 [Mycena galopus ATCC 62051]KAF8176226.1 hypothetical protein K438DRAFT_81374 [Mycena galopus ATCC 62051]
MCDCSRRRLGRVYRPRGRSRVRHQEGYAPYKRLEGEALSEVIFATRPNTGACVYLIPSPPSSSPCLYDPDLFIPQCTNSIAARQSGPVMYFVCILQIQYRQKLGPTKWSRI